ncbi:TlpA family protein disulfide reductase [Herbiconiux ginsengi]|uniref:Thiol-disulfide isomerase or thioredoxin n=1 Tax=Herbiconiux ginsengi TaxID=381665 RepID=A0A1H3U147_9MICO|nr:TlpA disulfide reductase family protein [Herbiconiux ginsengi]SDZ56234.1 Thiol-disulfide isomerase or thioredoxin [Herbiconiux ginsengi]
MRIRAWVAIALLIIGICLTACSNDALAEQYRDGGSPGFIAGDGAVIEVPEAERVAPIVLADVEDMSGIAVEIPAADARVTVVNFWYAGCAPCRAEAADLIDVARQTEGSGASFLGVNVRDTAATAQSFIDGYRVPYPNVIDSDGAVQFAFAGEIAPNAVPTTLVLDREGRVSSRILGTAEPSILLALIKSAND